MAKILIVDDSRTSRRMLREMLQGLGHEVIGEATNGQEAVVCFKARYCNIGYYNAYPRWN